MLRDAAVAGSWYPSSAPLLRAELERYLSAVAAHAGHGRLIGLIAPHAGLMFSGAVAAHAYALLRGRRDLPAILVGPSHRLAFEGVAVWAAGAFSTPLGRAPVDEALARRLLRHGVTWAGIEPHVEEHSLEMQLPFLQHLVAGLRIVPALMGRQSRATIEALGRALALVAARQDALLVASSDLSHYHAVDVARELDAELIADVQGLDLDALLARLERFPGHACGGGPLAAVMAASLGLGATRAEVLRYGHSGQAGERDLSRVVGYLAAAFWAEGRN